MELEKNEKILQAKKDLQEVFDIINDGIVLVDRNYRILRLNRSWLLMSGKEKYSEVLGRKCYEVLHDRRAICGGCAAAEVFRTGKQEMREEVLDKPAGTPSIYLYRSVPWRKEATGEVTSVMTVISDVTEIRRMHSERAHIEKIEAVGHLAGASAHEINQPLGVIIGRAQLMLSNLEPENPDYNTLHKNITEILEQAGEINCIIKQLASVISHVTKPYVDGKEILDLRKSSSSKDDK